MSLSYTPWSYMPSEIIQLGDAFFGRKSPSNQITLSVKIIKQIKANQFLVADATGYRKIEQSWQENGVAKKFHKQ